MLDNSLYPEAVGHHTTLTVQLIVQGIDLSLLLPLSFVLGYLLLRKRFLGYLFAPGYLVFLSLLMMALVGKIVYVGILGYNIIPVIFIIPVIEIISIICV